MKNIEEEDFGTAVEIGRWKISADYGVLSSPNGTTLVLQPRLSKLLYLLSVNANKIVPREYLVKNIWQDLIVNDESLTRAIADLRKLLTKHFDDTLVIHTIPKRGYKLLLKAGPKLYALKFKIGKGSVLGVIGFICLLLGLLWVVIF